jgi:hypothetical protein
MWLDALELALIITMLASSQLNDCGTLNTLGLAVLEFLYSTPRDLAHMQKMATIN